MGGMSSYDPEFKRKDLIAEVVDDYQREGKYLAHSAVGNTLYLVTSTEGSGNVILVYAMKGPSKDDFGGWGYRLFDETQGPGKEDCPERLLKLSNCEHPGAVAWRQRCRDKRARKIKLKNYIKSLKSGEPVSRHDGEEKILFLRRHSDTYFVGQSAEGSVYRYRVDTLDLPK